MAFQLTSPSFVEGDMIPKKYTCDGEDISPALQWINPPGSTKSFVLIMDDPDAPVGTWVHWAIYDIPATLKGLEEGLAKTQTLPNGARQGLAWGVNQFSRIGYNGPCPPPGAPHRYYFKLYALDTLLNLSPKATKNDIESAMKGHVLGETQLMGKVGR